MNGGAALWWERRWLWLPAAVFALLGLVALAVYEVAIAGRLGIQAGSLAARRGELEALSARRLEAEALVQRARSTRAAIAELYEHRLGTEAERLTAVMLEIKRLARQAGLSGMEAISYGDESVAGLPLVKKSVTFSALGNYGQLRAFINLLELSPTFLSLDGIRVSGGDRAGGALRLQVQLSTLFVTADGEPRAKR